MCGDAIEGHSLLFWGWRLGSYDGLYSKYAKILDMVRNCRWFCTKQNEPFGDQRNYQGFLKKDTKPSDKMRHY